MVELGDIRTRLSKLEGDMRVNNNSIDNLSSKLTELTEQIKWMVRLTFSAVLSLAGWLLVYVIGGGIK